MNYRHNASLFRPLLHIQVNLSALNLSVSGFVSIISLFEMLTNFHSPFISAVL